MSRRRITVLVLLIASIALGINETIYHFNGNVPRGFGYGVGPWIVGAIVSGAIYGVQKAFGRNSDFVWNMTKVAGVMIVLLIASAIVRI